MDGITCIALGFYVLQTAVEITEPLSYKWFVGCNMRSYGAVVSNSDLAETLTSTSEIKCMPSWHAPSIWRSLKLMHGSRSDNVQLWTSAVLEENDSHRVLYRWWYLCSKIIALAWPCSTDFESTQQLNTSMISASMSTLMGLPQEKLCPL